MNVTKLYLLNVCMRIDFWQIDYVQRPHDRFINLWQIINCIQVDNYKLHQQPFSIQYFVKKYNLFALRKQRRAYMLCKYWLTFPRKGHVGLVQNKTKQNKTGVYFRTRRKLIIEPVLQLLNIP